MKVVFAGPSIYGLELDLTGIELRRPAQMGDLEQAVADGATVIGLVDGHYQQVGAIWHKEILHALEAGVRVLGASSMGALRAAECQEFGMEPVGDIAHRFCRGTLFDDSDVAILNGPAEMGYMPLTEPLVSVEATLLRLADLGELTPRESDLLSRTARSMFFQDRTVDALFEAACLGARGEALQAAYERHRVDLKALDALMLIDRMRAMPDLLSGRNAQGWSFVQSPFWVNRPLRAREDVTPV